MKGELLVKGINHVIRRLEFSAPFPDGREKELETEFIINHALVVKPSKKPSLKGFGELPDWETHGGGKRVVPLEGHRNSTLSPYIVLCIFSLSVVFFVI